jgi:hypothetical protein
MTRRQIIWFIVFAFVVAICLHIELIMKGFYGISADESGRTLDALQWISSGIPISDVWLPFHRIVVGFGISLFNDLFITPRVISFMFGLIALTAIVWLAYELFRDYRITCLTALLAAFFPLRVVLSVVPLSEIEFIAFIAAGFASYTRWAHSRGSLSLLATGLFLGLSTSIRYEGWVFVILIIMELFFERENRKQIFHRPIIGIMSLILMNLFIAYWIYITYADTKTLFSFINATTSNYRRVADMSFVRLIWRNPATQFFYQNVVTLNFVGIISLFGLSRSQKDVRRLVLIVLPTLAVLAFLGLIGKALPTHNPWRIPAVISCLLVPFTAYWIVQQMERFSSLRWMRYGIPAIVLFAFAIQVGVMTRSPIFTRSEFLIGRFVREKLKENNLGSPKVLIETSDWSYLNIVLASNKPDLFIYNTGFWPCNSTYPIINTHEPLNISNLNERKIRFLVLKSKIQCNLRSNKSIQEIGHFGEWSIYEITKIQ